MDRGYVITIDGPAGAGKSTVARLLAETLGYIYLDTGAIYRAVALKALQEKIALDDEPTLVGLCRSIRLEFKIIDNEPRIFVDNIDFSASIRTEEISLAASAISVHPALREALLEIQRDMGKEGRIVAEGRDTGTVVFPQADYKIFLNADVEERIKRRYRELSSRMDNVAYKELVQNMRQRDMQDSERPIAPLKPASDAIVIDSTYLSPGECVERILNIIRRA